MYKSDYFTEEQMTKYEILSDSNKVWDKTLAHFTELFSLRKAYGDDRAANSGFESAAHIRDHSSAHSIITATTESDLTRDLYIESLEESLTVACHQPLTPHASPNRTHGTMQASVGSHGTE